jgi:maltose alpha-D-glucosyltransferase/alpha-amylase
VIGDYEKALALGMRCFLDPAYLKPGNTAPSKIASGGYHLGHVLYTGKGLVIIEFEGEPAPPISRRRLKASPLRDVAGMLRSFHYDTISMLKSRGFRSEDISTREPLARLMHLWVCVTFLRAYLESTNQSVFLPKSTEELKIFLDLHVFEKEAYELAYELNNQPDWVGVPIRGILEMLASVN